MPRRADVVGGSRRVRGRPRPPHERGGTLRAYLGRRWWWSRGAKTNISTGLVGRQGALEPDPPAVASRPDPRDTGRWSSRSIKPSSSRASTRSSVGPWVCSQEREISGRPGANMSPSIRRRGLSPMVRSTRWSPQPPVEELSTIPMFEDASGQCRRSSSRMRRAPRTPSSGSSPG